LPALRQLMQDRIRRNDTTVQEGRGVPPITGLLPLHRRNS
jgi:hypothetical protein